MKYSRCSALAKQQSKLISLNYKHFCCKQLISIINSCSTKISYPWNPIPSMAFKAFPKCLTQLVAP